MSSDIQKAIQEKRRQLELLKQRKHAHSLSVSTSTLDLSKVAPVPSPTSASSTPKPKESTEDVLGSIDQLLGVNTAAAASAPSSSSSSESKFKPRSAVSLTPVTLPGIEIAPIEVISYDKEVQVNMQLEEADMDNAKLESELARQLQLERKQLLEREKELQRLLEEARDNRAKFEAAQEQLRRSKQLTPADRDALLESSEFKQFFERTTLVMERALSARDQEYDFTVDYSAEEQEEKGLSRVREKTVRRLVFEDAQRSKRPITAMHWSPKYPELLLAAYAKPEDNISSLDPDGTVLVWNMNMSQRPEYTFISQSSVTCAMFHPSNPKLVIGGTWSGQVVIWDMREKSTPVFRTSLSRGHTHPVFAIRTVPMVNGTHNIVSVSTDGHLCVWSDNNLHEPALELDLKLETESDSKTSGTTKEEKLDITSNSFAFIGRDTNSLILGSDEGNVYKARLHDKPGLFECFQAHDAPITTVECHPISGKQHSTLDNLFLTASSDWTVKLWNHAPPSTASVPTASSVLSNKTVVTRPRPLLTFESAKDYVYDVQWSPVHPALFVTGDGTGRIDFWDLGSDSETPAHTVQVDTSSTEAAGLGLGLPAAPGSDKCVSVAKLRWSDDGLYLAVGTSTGSVVVFAVDPSLALPSKDSTAKLSSMVARASVGQA